MAKKSVSEKLAGSEIQKSKISENKGFLDQKASFLISESKTESFANKSFLKTADKAEKKEAAQGSAGIKKGDKIKVDYTGSFDDGTVFDDSSKHGQPLEFEVGAGMIIPGFEKAVLGMKKGEEKHIHLEPCDAYGDINPEATKKIPKEHLPKGQEPKVGMILVINLPNGMQIPARITEVADKEVTIDLNHPLAGKCLNFKFKIVEVNA